MTTEPTLQNDTLDLIYEVTRQGPVDQLRRAETLDAKIVQVFASASVVIGLTGVAPEKVAREWFLYLALGAYGVVAVATLVGIWVRSHWHVFHSDTLLDDFWAESVTDTKYALASEFPIVYAKNRSILDRKGWATRVAIIATGVEVMAVGLLIISARVA